MELIKWVISIIAALFLIGLVVSVGVGISALLAIGGIVVFALLAVGGTASVIKETMDNQKAESDP